MEFTAKQLAQVLKGTVDGDENAVITKFAKIEHDIPSRIENPGSDSKTRGDVQIRDSQKVTDGKPFSVASIFSQNTFRNSLIISTFHLTQFLL